MNDIFERMREARLVRRMAQGESQAFTEFVNRYGVALHRLARSYARTEADAEDLTQDIMIAIARSISSFRGQSSLNTWSTRVALNHCLKHRERRRDPDIPIHVLSEFRDGAAEPAHRAEQSELRDRLQEALELLSEDHRTAVILHEFQGLTYSECAGVLEIPIGTVKSRLSNAFRRLRLSLSSYVLGDECPIANDSNKPQPPGRRGSSAGESAVDIEANHE